MNTTSTFFRFFVQWALPCYHDSKLLQLTPYFPYFHTVPNALFAGASLFLYIPIWRIHTIEKLRKTTEAAAAAAAAAVQENSGTSPTSEDTGAAGSNSNTDARGSACLHALTSTETEGRLSTDPILGGRTTL